MTSRPWLDVIQSTTGGSNQGLFLEPALLILAIGIVLLWWMQRYRNAQDAALLERHHSRVKDFLVQISDPGSHAEMEGSFRSRFSDGNRSGEFPEPWQTIDFAIKTEKSSLMTDDELFSCGIVFLGANLFPGQDRSWSVDDEGRIFLDVFQSGAPPNKEPLHLDLALILGEAISRAEVQTDFEFYSLFLEDFEK